MNLIKRIYEDRSDNIEEHEKTIVLFDEIETMKKLVQFLSDAYCFDTDLYFPEVELNIQQIFSRLGIGLDSSVFLRNIKFGASKYDESKNGCCEFNYSLNGDSLDNREDKTITYYLSNELFSGEKYAICPAVKLSSGNESLYYSVGSVPVIRQYSIKLNEEVTLIREYSKDEVLFIIEGKTNHLVIKVKKPVSKVVENNYQLDNEMLLLDYLKTLTESYDVMDVYNKLCELSLGNDISMYQEITVCESVKTEYGFCDSNLVSIKNGNIDCVVRTIGDKTITLSGNGNWSYVLSDEFVNFRINSGKTLKYRIETKSEKEMDDYTDGLLRYDVSTAKQEVENTRELVRKRCRLEDKRG